MRERGGRVGAIVVWDELLIIYENFGRFIRRGHSCGAWVSILKPSGGNIAGQAKSQPTFPLALRPDMLNWGGRVGVIGSVLVDDALSAFVLSRKHVNSYVISD